MSNNKVTAMAVLRNGAMPSYKHSVICFCTSEVQAVHYLFWFSFNSAPAYNIHVAQLLEYYVYFLFKI